jgi:hypothetical protein
MTPYFPVSQHKFSAARVQEVKQQTKQEINSALNLYYEFGDARNHSYQEKDKQEILRSLTFMYNKMCLNKRII